MRSSSARSFLDVTNWWKQRFVAPVRKRRPVARHRKLFAESLESRMVLSVAGLDAYIAAEPMPDLATVEWVEEAATTTVDADATDDAFVSTDLEQIAAGEAACAAGAADDEGAGDGSGGEALNPDDVVLEDEVLELGEGEGSGTGSGSGSGSPPEISSAMWERSGEYWFISGLVTDDEDMFGQTAYFGDPLNTSVTINAEWNFYLTVEGWGDNPPSSIDIYTIDADGNQSGIYTLYFT